MLRVITTLILTLGLSGAADAAAQSPQSPQPTGPGRVVATVSVEGLRVPGVTVELRDVTGNVVIGRTVTDTIGQTTIPDVPAGRYIVRATRDGFANAESAPFAVAAGETEQVLIEMRLTFVRESVDVVVPANSPTESLQPVAVSDLLTGAKMDIQPLAGDDFQSLLTVLPSIIRGPEGRLRIKGGAPTTGALQMSSASLNDPSTGDFDLELPSGAVESVEVLSNPFAAEYGRFSTSVTQVRTKRGTNDWVIKPDNLMPGFGKGFAFVNKFEPRLSISGPLKKDKLLLGEYLQYRYARTPVKSLPGEPQLGLDSFDSFTRLDAVLSSRHALTGGVIYFPRKITNATMSTFRPEETTPKFSQSGFSAGMVDRLILSAHAVLEIDLRRAHVRGRSEDPGRAADGLRAAGAERQLLQSPGAQRPQPAAGRSADGLEGSVARPARLQVRRGLAAARASTASTTARKSMSSASTARSPSAPPTLRSRRNPEVTGTEFALFAQDRWRVNDRLNFEFGFRSDRDDVVEKVNYSPRVGMSVSVLPEGRAIIRGGFGKFAERTPLTVGAFTQYDIQTISRFAANGIADRHADHLHARRRRRAEDAGEHRPDGRLGPAVRPPVLLQGRLSPPQRFARLHGRPRQRPRTADARIGRRVEVLGSGDDRPLSRERAPRHQRVLRSLAQHARPQRLRSVLRQLPQSDHPAATNTLSARPTCPTG